MKPLSYLISYRKADDKKNTEHLSQGFDTLEEAQAFLTKLISRFIERGEDLVNWTFSINLLDGTPQEPLFANGPF